MYNNYFNAITSRNIKCIYVSDTFSFVLLVIRAYYETEFFIVFKGLLCFVLIIAGHIKTLFGDIRVRGIIINDGSISFADSIRVNIHCTYIVGYNFSNVITAIYACCFNKLF